MCVIADRNCVTPCMANAYRMIINESKSLLLANDATPYNLPNLNGVGWYKWIVGGCQSHIVIVVDNCNQVKFLLSHVISKGRIGFPHIDLNSQPIDCSSLKLEMAVNMRRISSAVPCSTKCSALKGHEQK